MSKLEPLPEGVKIDDSILKHIDRRFVSSLDLIGKGDVTVKIDRVEKHDKIKYQNGQTAKNPILLYFTHTPKPLVLNVTNIKTLTIALGTSNCKEWKGRKVKVFAEKGNYFGKDQYAVRFRDHEVTE